MFLYEEDLKNLWHPFLIIDNYNKSQKRYNNTIKKMNTLIIILFIDINIKYLKRLHMFTLKIHCVVM